MAQMAKVAELAGAQALSLVNTFLALAIDPETRRAAHRECDRWAFRAGNQADRGAEVYEAASRGENSGCRHGRHLASGRCGGVPAGGGHGGAGGDGQLCRSAGSRDIATGLKRWCASHGVERVASLTGGLIV